MNKIEFFITAANGGYVLMDQFDAMHIESVFSTKEDAADMAVRFCQDNGYLWVIYY